MSKLYQARRGHYCGPTAVAAITGLPVEQVSVLVNRLRKRPDGQQVYGTYWHELIRILRDLGYTVNTIRLPAKPKGHKVLRVLDLEERLGWSSVHLIETKTHFLAMRDGLVVDSATPQGKLLRDHPNRRMHATCVAIVYAPRAR